MARNHILLVDDEKVIRDLGKEMIEILGFRCITARNGEEGIELFKRNFGKILVVILDVEMPGISGEAVSRIISGEFPGTKIVFISGYDKEYLEQKVFNRKIENFVPKPLNMKSLSRMFEEMQRDNAV